MSRLTDAYVGPGDVLPVAAPYDVTVGAGCLVGKLFGVALNTALSGAAVNIATEGVFKLAHTSGQVLAVGALCYWDDTAKSVTGVSTSNTRIGCAAVAAASGDALIAVRLNGQAAPTGA